MRCSPDGRHEQRTDIHARHALQKAFFGSILLFRNDRRALRRLVAFAHNLFLTGRKSEIGRLRGLDNINALGVTWRRRHKGSAVGVMELHAQAHKLGEH